LSLVVIDTETTGLLRSTLDPKQQPGIIQIAAIKLNDRWEEIGSYETIMDPETFMEEDALKTHGITLEKARPFGPLTAHFYNFAEFILGAKTWVGFNCEFDKNVLWWQLLRYNLQTKFPWPPYELDVMKVSRDIVNIQGKQDLKYPSLWELHQHFFGEGFEWAHDALADCRATARCGKRLFDEGIV
jgi:DNA polymerase III epsilon subunit-like protein